MITLCSVLFCTAISFSVRILWTFTIPKTALPSKKMCQGWFLPISNLRNYYHIIVQIFRHKLSCQNSNFINASNRPTEKCNLQVVPPLHLLPILPTSHFTYFPFCLLPILSTSHFANFPSSQVQILPIPHFAYFSSSQVEILPIPHSAYFPLKILPTLLSLYLLN